MDGIAGSSGPSGPSGPAGRDGAEGGTPTLLTNRFEGLLTFGDGDAVVEIQRQAVVAPGAGQLAVRLYYQGTVAKRPGIRRCLVTIRMRRDDQGLPLDSHNAGILDGPQADRVELTVAGTLAERVTIAEGERVLLRAEVLRADPECADGDGPTQIARIFGRMEVQFYRYTLGE